MLPTKSGQQRHVLVSSTTRIHGVSTDLRGYQSADADDLDVKEKTSTYATPAVQTIPYIVRLSRIPPLFCTAVNLNPGSHREVDEAGGNAAGHDCRRQQLKRVLVVHGFHSQPHEEDGGDQLCQQNVHQLFTLQESTFSNI